MISCNFIFTYPMQVPSSAGEHRRAFLSQSDGRCWTVSQTGILRVKFIWPLHHGCVAARFLFAKDQSLFSSRSASVLSHICARTRLLTSIRRKMFRTSITSVHISLFTQTSLCLTVLLHALRCVLCRGPHRCLFSTTQKALHWGLQNAGTCHLDCESGRSGQEASR